MEAATACPFRYIHKGRTFCAIAIRERRFTTTEVNPSACSGCAARKALETAGCAFLNLGVEVDQYGGSLDVNIFYASCEKLVERLSDFRKCGPDCPYWGPLDDERVTEIRQEALQALRDKEARFGD
jgi:hypothetical protein